MSIPRLFLVSHYFSSLFASSLQKVLKYWQNPAMRRSTDYNAYYSNSSKIDNEGFTDIFYYDTRFILILFSIAPCLIFKTTENMYLYGSVAVIFSCLILFDPIHELLNVGYLKKGFKSYSYSYINYVCAITFFGIVAGATVLKRVVERSESENRMVNTKREEALTNLEKQNKQITAGWE
jgi:hypothetical protein